MRKFLRATRNVYRLLRTYELHSICRGHLHACYLPTCVCACLATEYAGHPHAGKSHSRACTHNHKMIIHVEVCAVYKYHLQCAENTLWCPPSLFSKCLPRQEPVALTPGRHQHSMAAKSSSGEQPVDMEPSPHTS